MNLLLWLLGNRRAGGTFTVRNGLIVSMWRKGSERQR